MRNGLRRQRANDLSRVPIRLKPNAGADSKRPGKAERGAQHRSCAPRNVPGVRAQPRGVGPESIRVEETRPAHLERRSPLGKIPPTRHGCIFKRRPVTAAGKVKRKVRLGLRTGSVLSVNMHSEHIEAHAQHAREICLEILIVIDADAVEKVGPGQKSADGKARRGRPRLALLRQTQLSSTIDRRRRAVDAEDHALPLQKVEYRVKQGLFAGSMESGALT